VVVQTQHVDFYAAVDLAADKLQRQLTKFKARRDTRVRRGRAGESREFRDMATGSPPPAEAEEE
jgi:ribosome-associated translation inhibitor RaiA